MNRIKVFAFTCSSILFLGFLANVIAGTLGQFGIIGDVSEALLLFGSCFFFVIAVLIMEYQEQDSSQLNSNQTLKGEPKSE